MNPSGARAPRAPDPRAAALAALAAGLALSTLGPPGHTPLVLITLSAALLAVRLLRAASAPVALAAALAALGLGLILGEQRISAIDGSALRARPGSTLRVEGHLVTPPRAGAGRVRLLLSTAAGRIAVDAADRVPEVSVGGRLSAIGVVRPPPPWLSAHLRRQGTRLVLAASHLRLLPGGRRGVTGAVDAVRARALRGLGSGLGEREAALLRGFVLGADDAIDERTRTDFNRSGLAHLLAVSGQNVALLAALALPLLALAGLGLRARYLAVLGLIALYVPLAGAGPSIQRAGVMGAAGIAALLASRPGARWHALFLAAALTLLLNPLAVGDVGWQLSFAAVGGIAVAAAPIRRAALRLTGSGDARRALADGIALTLAAAAATAPLTVHHFESLSLAALPANVAALPAVAPAMWFGMVGALLAQVPGLPLEPVTLPAGACAAYIAAVASAFAAPSWASIPVSAPFTALIVATGVLAVACAAATRALSRRTVHTRAVRIGAGALCASAALLLAGRELLAGPVSPIPPGALVRFEALDVGQGDAILIRPRGAAPVLVDAGPPGAEIPEHLRDRGIKRLALVVLTHADLDHAGGVPELVGQLEVDVLALGRPAPAAEAAARSAGVRIESLAEGDVLHSGPLRLEVLWPPPATDRTPVLQGVSENAASVVFLATVRRFRMLLAGDAEQESTPLDPGRIDVLKVAHHGSDDAGLPALLASTTPRIAVISVGPGNRHGHPTSRTIRALRGAGTAIRRTDREGTIAIDVMPRGFAASAVG